MPRMTGPDCAVMCNLINTHTHIHVTSIIDPPWEDQYEWHRMTRMTGPDCAVMCNLINTHTHTHTHTHDPPLGGSMRVAQNDWDDKAGLRGYMQFNKYAYTHTRARARV